MPPTTRRKQSKQKTNEKRFFFVFCGRRRGRRRRRECGPCVAFLWPAVPPFMSAFPRAVLVLFCFTALSESFCFPLRLFASLCCPVARYPRYYVGIPSRLPLTPPVCIAMPPRCKYGFRLLLSPAAVGYSFPRICVVFVRVSQLECILY